MNSRTAAVLLTTTTLVPAQLGLECKNTANAGQTQPDDAIEVPYSPTLVPKTGLTVEAWITYDESTLGTGWRWPTVCRQNPAPGQEAYFLRIGASNTNVRSLVWGVATGFGFRRARYDFAAGEFTTWTHVAGTYDGTTLRLFVNGVERGSFTNSSASHMVDRGGVLRIGTGNTAAAANQGIEMWNGGIDEFRLWPVARTAAEIQSTMNLALSSVPGVVSTWGLDFSAADTSGQNNGSAIGNPNYVTNTNSLTFTDIGAAAFGAGTAGCSGTPAAGVTGYCQVGNQGFGVTCLNSATGAGSVGFFWFGLARFSTPVNLLGADLWADPSAPGVLAAVLGDADGLLRLPAPVPANAPANTNLHCQFVFSQNGCSVPLFASEGLTLTIKP